MTYLPALDPSTLDSQARHLSRALAANVADHIVRFPHTYDQGSWGDEDGSSTMGTTRLCEQPACVAGWAVRLATPEHLDMAYGSVMDSLDTADLTSLISLGGMDAVHVSSMAQVLLGVEECEGDSLFASSRTTDEVLEALYAIAAGSSLPDWMG